VNSSFLLSASTLCRREIVRFLRDRSRIFSAVGTPLIFWLFLGSGVGKSFTAGPESGSYLEYYFPGTVVLILLFTSIFATISIIEDRKEGFLQAVLVAPIPRSSFVFGKLLGATALGLIQGILFMLLAPLVGFSWHIIPITIVMMALVAFSLTGLGYIIAWRLDSSQGFHAIMMTLLIPMWLLSGAVFPANNASVWMKALIMVNPLTYGLAAVRWAMYGSECGSGYGTSFRNVITAITVYFRSHRISGLPCYDEAANMKRAILLMLLFTSCVRKSELPVMNTVPEFTFIERSSREVKSQELAGKVWVADFVFTRCGGFCPLMTEKMRKLQDMLPAQIQLVSFSVDPQHDTPEALAAYAKKYGADPNRWWFLTGNKEGLYRLSKDGFKLAIDDTAWN
jgi:ABC-2 type transport system permease protein